MKGGAKGLLQNSVNLCSRRAQVRSDIDFTAHSGKLDDSEPRIGLDCGQNGGNRHRHSGHWQRRRG